MNQINETAARKAALIAQAKARSAKPEDAVLTKTPPKAKEHTPPEDTRNKIRIIFDNSGSMADKVYVNKTQSKKIEEAKKGSIEFLRNCTLNEDSVAVHLLEIPSYFGDDEENEDGSMNPAKLSSLLVNATLTSDLVRLASAIDNENLRDYGGTPLYETCLRALQAMPKATRCVAFSDGQPNNNNNEQDVYRLAKDYKIPIDTVYFGAASKTGAGVMKKLAEMTGGIFIAFDPAKGVSFKDSFKYLSPKNRLMLMDKSFKEKVERGEI